MVCHAAAGVGGAGWVGQNGKPLFSLPLSLYGLTPPSHCHYQDHGTGWRLLFRFVVHSLHAQTGRYLVARICTVTFAT